MRIAPAIVERARKLASDADASTRRPVHEVKVRTVVVAIWQNETRSGPVFNATVSRLYRDEHGKWSSSTSLGRDDLLNAAKALDMAHTWICQQGGGRTQEEE